VDTWQLGSKDRDSRFALQAGLDLKGTHGTITITAAAEFLAGSGRPIITDHEAADQAGDVPSQTAMPQGWTANGTLERTLVFKWCFAGPKDTWYKFVKGTNPDWQELVTGENLPVTGSADPSTQPVTRPTTQP